MFHLVIFTLIFGTAVSSLAAAKQKVQIDVEVWKNGRLDSKPKFVIIEGEEGQLTQSSDDLSFKLNISPKNSGFSDKAFKIALEYVEIKGGEDQEPLLANVETSSYSVSTVKFLPPTQGADPVELKITAKPL